MPDYTALKAIWPSLAGANDSAKCDALNAMTVPGPNVDVAAGTVLGFLMTSGVYLKLATFAAGGPTSDPTHDTALGIAKMLMALLSSPNAPPFKMSDATTHATVKGMMDALLAQETAVAGSTGITSQIHDGLLALSAVSVPWWQVNGLTSAVNVHDLVPAGLTTVEALRAEGLLGAEES